MLGNDQHSAKRFQTRGTQLVLIRRQLCNRGQQLQFYDTLWDAGPVPFWIVWLIGGSSNLSGIA